MTDIELLTAAAKAAKQPIEFTNGVPVPFIEDGVVFAAWNPLEDDGDALRLAVKLGIHMYFNDTYVDAGVKPNWGVPRELEADPYAATRRATRRASR